MDSVPAATTLKAVANTVIMKCVKMMVIVLLVPAIMGNVKLARHLELQIFVIVYHVMMIHIVLQVHVSKELAPNV
jgi:small-conductance mechanosensitive channel